jgi:hypothetical protein
MKRPATKRLERVALSRTAVETLGGGGEGAAARAQSRLEGAVRLYLHDKGTDRPAWPYPDFLRDAEHADAMEVEFRVDSALWRSFRAVAREQDVSVDRLAEHAAFYFAAELDAGRITQRILDDSEPDAEA